MESSASIMFIVGCNECEPREMMCDNVTNDLINCSGGEWDYDNPIDCGDLDLVCQDGACVEPECTDSDGGINYDMKGYIEYGDMTAADSCNGAILTEFFCDPDFGEPLDYQYTCPNTCFDGACITPTYTDSDGGLNYSMRGTTNSVKLSPGGAAIEWTDTCLKDYEPYFRGEYVPPVNISVGKGLLEGKCGPNLNEPGVVIAYECPYNCSVGACS